MHIIIAITPPIHDPFVDIFEVVVTLDLSISSVNLILEFSTNSPILFSSSPDQFSTEIIVFLSSEI